MESQEGLVHPTSFALCNLLSSRALDINLGPSFKGAVWKKCDHCFASSKGEWKQALFADILKIDEVGAVLEKKNCSRFNRSC